MSKAAKSFASLPAEHVKEQQETKHKADKEKKENVVDHVLFIDSQNRTEGNKKKKRRKKFNSSWGCFI